MCVENAVRSILMNNWCDKLGSGDHTDVIDVNVICETLNELLRNIQQSQRECTAAS
jgi:hypothetical protein